MGARYDRRLASKIRTALAGALGIAEDDMDARAGSSNSPDLIASTADRTYLVDFKSTVSAGQIAGHADHAAAAAKRSRSKRAVPLLAVPFMGDAAKRACEHAGLSWFDLSGNARIIAPGLRIIIDGRPNQFGRRGRPATVFAPKSSRVARWLLMNHDKALTQREIAHATGLGEGFVSRIAARLEEEGYVVRDQHRALRVTDPERLLDAWQEQYSFSKHTIIKGHVAARSGDVLARVVSDALAAQQIEHAATGLAAAWQLTHFAMFRIATIYVDREPTLHQLGFRDDHRGANLWIVLPKDAGVYHGAAERDGIRCVHPVQAYLDLQGHPERATEAAERLRAEFLSW